MNEYFAYKVNLNTYCESCSCERGSEFRRTWENNKRSASCQRHINMTIWQRLRMMKIYPFFFFLFSLFLPLQKQNWRFNLAHLIFNCLSIFNVPNIIDLLLTHAKYSTQHRINFSHPHIFEFVVCVGADLCLLCSPNSSL